MCNVLKKFLSAWKKENSALPRIYPIPRDDPIFEKFQEDVKAAFLTYKWKTLVDNDDLEKLLGLLKQKETLNYSEYRELARTAGSTLETLLSASLFAQLQSDYRLSVQVLRKYLEEKTWLQHSRFSLAVFTDYGKSFMTESDLERYVNEFMPSTCFDLKQLGEDFIEFYVCTIVRKFIFFLDPYRSGRIRVTDIVASGFLKDLKKLAIEEFTDCREINWFSAKNCVWLYLHYSDLDKNQNGLLDKEEMSGFEEGALTDGFIDRVFQACQTYGGEIDFKTFLDLTLALENRSEPQSILFIFRILDVNNVGYLDTFALHYFYRSIEKRLKETHRDLVPFENVCTEIFDMVKPADANRITFKDLIGCGKGSTALSIIIDFESFCSYESREEQIKDEVDAILEESP